MKTMALLASLVACAGSAVAQTAGPAVSNLAEEIQKEADSLNPQYLVFSPQEKPDGKLPLVIYLHGAGGVGKDLRKVRGQAATVWQGIQKFDKGPCLLIAPQCLKRGRDGGGWQPEHLNLLLEHLQATLPVDPKRIYLTGNSMGGYGSWAWGGHSPQHFAAIAPVSGGIGARGPKDVAPDLDQWIANLAKVPVYAFAGAKDKVVPPERSERAITAIQKAGGKDAKLKIYPDQAHNARSVVYTTAEFYDWMFSKQRE